MYNHSVSTCNLYTNTDIQELTRLKKLREKVLMMQVESIKIKIQGWAITILLYFGQAKEGTFNKETFDDLCWMMTAKKNHRPSVVVGVCSRQDCFKLFCLFNLLSEDHYPLVMIPAEVRERGQEQPYI